MKRKTRPVPFLPQEWTSNACFIISVWLYMTITLKTYIHHVSFTFGVKLTFLIVILDTRYFESHLTSFKSCFNILPVFKSILRHTQ
jgi:hypothetical protein